MSATVPADPFGTAVLAALPNLRRYVTRGLHMAGADADDLVQQTVLLAYEARDRFTIGTSMEAWLRVIARNRCFHEARFHRKAKRHTPVEDADAFGLLPCSARQMDTVELREVLACIVTLPAERKFALRLSLHEIPYEDAAARTGIAEGTLKSRCARLRRDLRETFA